MRATKIERNRKDLYTVHLEGGKELILLVPETLPIEERVRLLLRGLKENNVEIESIYACEFCLKIWQSPKPLRFCPECGKPLAEKKYADPVNFGTLISTVE